MARANRHFLPGYVWHMTHRCHKKAFLLACGSPFDCQIVLSQCALDEITLPQDAFVIDAAHVLLT